MAQGKNITQDEYGFKKVWPHRGVVHGGSDLIGVAHGGCGQEDMAPGWMWASKNVFYLRKAEPQVGT